MSPAWASLAVASSASGYVGSVKWTVVATVEVPNLMLGQGVLEESVLGASDVMASTRGSVHREVTFVVEAPDEAEAQRVAVEQLTSGLGAELSGVPEIESISVEPDE
jgi:hypothetical protein